MGDGEILVDGDFLVRGSYLLEVSRLFLGKIFPFLLDILVRYVDLGFLI